MKAEATGNVKTGVLDDVARTALVAAVYVFVAAIGLRFAVVHGTVSPVWPATGFAIGALTLWGLHRWPAITVGALFANFVFADNPLAVAAGIAVGNTLEACLGAAALRWFNVSGEVARIRDGIVMVVVAIVAPVPSVVAGTISLGLGGFLPGQEILDAGSVWWWVGDTMGALVALPLVLGWFGRSASQHHVARPAELAAALLATVGFVGVTIMYFDTLARIGLIVPPMAAILFPPVLWAVLRFRPRDVSLVLAVGCTAAVFLTADQAGAEPIGPLLGLQTMLFALCGGTLVMVGAITHRIRIQMALSTSERRLSEAVARLNAIVHNAPLGIAAVSLPDRCFLWVNHGLCAITGYTPEELLQKTMLDITLPEDAPIGRTEYARLETRELESFTMEKRYVRKDGSVIWVRVVTASADTAENVRAAVAIGIIEDVTEARIAEEARRDAEQRLQLAVDIAELGLWEYDPVSERLVIAPKWLTRPGLKHADMEGTRRQWQQRVHPEDLDRVSRYLRAYLEHPEGQYTIEYRFRFSDGTYRWLSSRGVPVVDESGRLTKLIGTHLDVTERKRAEQRIREESLHDPLTGLPNRALILEYGSHLLSAERRGHACCAVLFVDLDHFKPINDTYGHEAGDAVLKEVARRLRTCTRQEDLVGRIGGDEFVIVLAHADQERHRVETVAQHVLDVVGRPIVIDGARVSVSPSIGASSFPDQGRDIETLLQKADKAMYLAKRAGRANYQPYTPDLERRGSDPSGCAARLESALHQGGLALYYQPIMSLRSGRVVAAEALLRVIQDDGNVTGPGGLLPGTESPKLNADLDQWVLNSACRQHVEWRTEGMPPILLSVNVSALYPVYDTFADKVREIVEESGIDPHSLQLELSQKSIDDESVAETISYLKSFGIKIALDGVGGGPLDLKRLSGLPLDRIKVALSYVSGVTEPPSIGTSARLFIAVGQALQLPVVGEGVESEEALHTLLDSGCDEAQGFYLGYPLPPADFARWYRARCELH